MKRLLLGCKCVEGVQKALTALGYIVYECDNELVDSDLKTVQNEVRKYIEKYSIEYIFSFRFSPDLAKVCAEQRVIYISWVWDCPHATLWAKEARLVTNRIFVFDYSLYEKLIEREIEHVYYLPLATDTEYFSKVIETDKENNKSKYASDVTFLGNFYNDEKHNLFDQINYMPPYVEGYLKGVIEAQRRIWGADLLENSISDSVWEDLKKYVKWDVNERYEEGYYEIIFQNLLGMKIAQLERMEMCSELNKRFSFTLYTDCDTSFDTSIENKGHADYLTQMPLIFNYSKINIHMTIRSITSGIPLRVMDVLACGGFLLTNYQSEIAEYFVDGEELVIYNDLSDMYSKIEYYLEHEEERKAIAHAGFVKVQELFSYQKQFEYIAEVIDRDEESSNY